MPRDNPPTLVSPHLKQVFVVPASGPEASQHYQETIRKKRQFAELERFLPSEDLKVLHGLYHGAPFAVWGARAGRGNARTFQQMNLGDYILFWQRGKIVLIGEIAWKATNRALAEHFWGTNPAGETWEHIYFIINERELAVPAKQLWQYLDYEEHLIPQGFMRVEGRRIENIETLYGGFYDVIRRLDGGLLISRKQEPLKESEPVPIPPSEEERPREHDEIQWRLIRLAHAAGVDVWVPRNDQGKEWEGQRFRDHVLPEFKEGLDIPGTVENIDAVWRFGYQIKAAFEIEHSTSIYSGLLRLSDLKVIAPNILYPLYVTAPRERRDKVLAELRRPTFHDQLRLHEVARYISYDKIRELDEEFGARGAGFRAELLEAVSEQVD